MSCTSMHHDVGGEELGPLDLRDKDKRYDKYKKRRRGEGERGVRERVQTLL